MHVNKQFALAGLALEVLSSAILASFMEPSTEQVEKVTDTSGTLHAPLVPLAGFLDSDCPSQGLSGLTSNASPGALDCTYHWNGKWGADNAEMRIMQYSTASIYDQIMETDLQNLQNQVAQIKTNQASGGGRQNDNIDILQADTNDYIYMETYNGSPAVGSTAVPLCGDGWGAMGVHAEFEVTFDLRESCDISTSASDYSALMRTMRDAAQAAINRAEKVMYP
ncbi:MAG: hypothetical protein WCE68_08425 [Anaerolineales bacterium]